MQERFYLNNNWSFSHLDDPAHKETVRLPHTNTVLPFNYLDERSYQFVSCYERSFIVPKTADGKLLFLTFEGAAHKAEVYVNGTKVGTHACGYTAFRFEISRFCRFGEENELKVILDSRESLNVPPFGHVIDYLTYGGIYREVYLDIAEKTYIDDVFVSTPEVKPEGQDQELSLWLNVRSEQDRTPGGLTIRYEVLDEAGSVLFEKTESSAPRGETRRTLTVPGLKLWNLEEPNVYTLRVSLLVGGRTTDTFETTFGVRTARFEADGFYLNGTRIKLCGLNRHQSYPYVGYAMPQSGQEYDARVLKEKLGVNAVRTSHYPQSKYFLDACDRLGIVVFTEAPGWQNIGDDAWKQQHLQNVRDMVLQNRNHPSIVLWGVRVNESQDDDKLYREANVIARDLDPSRQTSGVRYLNFSHMLEDVFAFNDFSHTGNNAGIQNKKLVTPKAWKPYLISEHNGHMYPTKSYDCEEHRLSQALRHAHVLNDVYAPDNGVSGAFGWCMFDYNTHKDFGSGDHICYHGVMDMFRNPKLAAALYASQSDDNDILEISSSMDIGDHPAGSLGDVYVFTNADYINLYKNGQYVRRFDPDKEDFPNLPHPPMKVDDLIGELLERDLHMSKTGSDQVKKAVHGYMHEGFGGIFKPAVIGGLAYAVVRDRITIKKGFGIFNNYVGNWGSDVTVYRFDAVRNGNVVKSITKAPMTSFALAAAVDHTDLREGSTYDVATINIEARSPEGNLLTYLNEPVCFRTEGELELIGPSCISLRGGMGGTYVRTTGKPGGGKLIISTERAEPVEIAFTVTGSEA